MIERFLFIVAGLFAGLLLAQSPYLGAPAPQQPSPRPVQKTAPPATTPTQEPKVPTSPLPEATSTQNTGTTYRVIKVHDGDTIAIDKDGASVKVRLIGMNAPEIYNNQKPAQCFGHEATTHAQELLHELSARIETDPSQDTYDKYGRLLAYAFLPDGTNFAERMIEEGYAHEYTYHLPYRYQKEFKAAQARAKSAGVGLWKSGVCTP